MYFNKKVVVLRIGHRIGRDKRISTHVGLVARAFGADGIIFVGDIEESITFNIDKGDTRTKYLYLNIPKELEEGDYIFTVQVQYDESGGNYDESVSGHFDLRIEGGNCIDPTQEQVTISTEQIGSAFSGEDVSFKIAITNLGNRETQFTISAMNYSSWATLSSIQPTTITLDASETGYAYITLTILTDVEDLTSFKVRVSSTGSSDEQTISVPISTISEAATSWNQFTFEIKRNLLWFLINAILLVAVIILIVLLATRPRVVKETGLKKKK